MQDAIDDYIQLVNRGAARRKVSRRVAGKVGFVHSGSILHISFRKRSCLLLCLSYEKSELFI